MKKIPKSTTNPQYQVQVTLKGQKNIRASCDCLPVFCKAFSAHLCAEITDSLTIASLIEQYPVLTCSPKRQQANCFFYSSYQWPIILATQVKPFPAWSLTFMQAHEKQELTGCELSHLALLSERSQSQKERKQKQMKKNIYFLLLLLFYWARCRYL